MSFERKKEGEWGHPMVWKKSIGLSLLFVTDFDWFDVSICYNVGLKFFVVVA